MEGSFRGSVTSSQMTSGDNDFANAFGDTVRRESKQNETRPQQSESNNILDMPKSKSRHQRKITFGNIDTENLAQFIPNDCKSSEGSLEFNSQRQSTNEENTNYYGNEIEIDAEDSEGDIDLVFIEEALEQSQADLMNQDNLSQKLKKLSNSAQNDQVDLIGDAITQQTNEYQKTIDYSYELLKRLKKSKKAYQIEKNENQNCQIILDQTNQQIMNMKEQWQEEQKIVLTLQNEVSYKDDSIMRLTNEMMTTKKLFEGSKKQVETLKEEKVYIQRENQQYESLGKGGMSDPGVKRKFDDLVLQNKKLADKIKDLELTIDDRNKQIEQSLVDFEKLEHENIGNIEMIQLQETDLNDAQRCFDDIEKEKVELENLVERLGQELARFEEMENKQPDDRLNGQLLEAGNKSHLGDDMTSRNSGGSSFYGLQQNSVKSNGSLKFGGFANRSGIFMDEIDGQSEVNFDDVQRGPMKSVKGFSRAMFPQNHITNIPGSMASSNIMQDQLTQSQCFLPEQNFSQAEWEGYPSQDIVPHSPNVHNSQVLQDMNHANMNQASPVQRHKPNKPNLSLNISGINDQYETKNNDSNKEDAQNSQILREFEESDRPTFADFVEESRKSSASNQNSRCGSSNSRSSIASAQQESLQTQARSPAFAHESSPEIEKAQELPALNDVQSQQMVISYQETVESSILLNRNSQNSSARKAVRASVDEHEPQVYQSGSTENHEADPNLKLKQDQIDQLRGDLEKVTLEKEEANNKLQAQIRQKDQDRQKEVELWLQEKSQMLKKIDQIESQGREMLSKAQKHSNENEYDRRKMLEEKQEVEKQMDKQSDDLLTKLGAFEQKNDALLNDCVQLKEENKKLKKTQENDAEASKTEFEAVTQQADALLNDCAQLKLENEKLEIAKQDEIKTSNTELQRSQQAVDQLTQEVALLQQQKTEQRELAKQGAEREAEGILLGQKENELQQEQQRRHDAELALDRMKQDTARERDQAEREYKTKLDVKNDMENMQESHKKELAQLNTQISTLLQQNLAQQNANSVQVGEQEADLSRVNQELATFKLKTKQYIDQNGTLQEQNTAYVEQIKEQGQKMLEKEKIWSEEKAQVQEKLEAEVKACHEEDKQLFELEAEKIKQQANLTENKQILMAKETVTQEYQLKIDQIKAQQEDEMKDMLKNHEEKVKKLLDDKDEDHRQRVRDVENRGQVISVGDIEQAESSLVKAQQNPSEDRPSPIKDLLDIPIKANQSPVKFQDADDQDLSFEPDKMNQSVQITRQDHSNSYNDDAMSTYTAFREQKKNQPQAKQSKADAFRQKMEERKTARKTKLDISYDLTPKGSSGGKKFNWAEMEGRKTCLFVKPVDEAPQAVQDNQENNSQLILSPPKPQAAPIQQQVYNNPYIVNNFNMSTNEGSAIQQPPPSKRVALVDIDDFLAKGLTFNQQVINNNMGRATMLPGGNNAIRESNVPATQTLQSRPQQLEKKNEPLLNQIQQLPAAGRAGNCCRKCGGGMSSRRSSVLSSQSEGEEEIGPNGEVIKKRRNLGQRKDPEVEFFTMSLLGQIMKNSKYQNVLLQLQGNSEKLLAQCRKEHKDFYDWNDWIANYVAKYVEKIKKKKLALISRRKEMQKRVEMKNKQQSK